MSEPVSKLFPCKLCGQQVMVEFFPNDMIGEDFIRTMLVCDCCQRSRNKHFVEPVKVQADLPYKD